MLQVFYSVSGKYLGSVEDDLMTVLKIGDQVTRTFGGQPYSEWEVVSATPLLDGLQRVIITPVLRPKQTNK